VTFLAQGCKQELVVDDLKNFEKDSVLIKQLLGEQHNTIFFILKRVTQQSR
jgi:hypothetical protein